MRIGLAGLDHTRHGKSLPQLAGLNVPSKR
jgi:hypothetical protein